MTTLVSRFVSPQRALSAVAIASWLGCASRPPTIERKEPQSNWTSPEAPCAKFDDLRRPLLRDIGVKIDAAEPWADGFRRALGFWNSILVAEFHEENDLSACSIRIIDGTPDILDHAVAARSQIIDWANFKGKIAVSHAAAKEMDSAEVYATSVHEVGHLLGLKHNADTHSVMYFLDVDGTGVLDEEDILDLRRHHQLRPAIVAHSFVPIQASSTEIAATSAARATGQ